MMRPRAFRVFGYASTVTGVGVRPATTLERRLTGANAVTRRGLIAYRAAMAALFHAAKNRKG